MAWYNFLIRQFLKSASSKETLASRTAFLAQFFRFKYEPFALLASSGVEDILHRKQFLIEEAYGKVLDVGCFDGYFSIELAKAGYDVVGLDTLNLALDIANKDAKGIDNVWFVRGYSEELPFKHDSFDTAILSHTLEHVFDPILALKEAARVTKKNGKLIAIVPTELGNAADHLRYVRPLDLYNLMSQYACTGEKLHVGKGIGYIGIVK